MFIYKLSCSWVDCAEHSHWGKISVYSGVDYFEFSYLEWFYFLTIWWLRMSAELVHLIDHVFFLCNHPMIPQQLGVTFINCVTHTSHVAHVGLITICVKDLCLCPYTCVDCSADAGLMLGHCCVSWRQAAQTNPTHTPQPLPVSPAQGRAPHAQADKH